MPGDYIDKTGTGYDVEGTRLQAVAKQLLTPKGVLTAGKSSPTGIPIPNSPFLVSSVTVTKKGRLRGEFSATLPDNSKHLETQIVQTSMRTSDALYQASILTDRVKVDQDTLAANAGFYLYLFSPLLEANTQYDLLQLIVDAATADGGTGEVSNPESRPAFNAAPLAQFTTGAVVGGPSDPAANQIVINRLDPQTKKFDAEMAFRVYAPLDAGNNAVNWQTWLGANVIAVLDLGAGADHNAHYTVSAIDTLTDPASPIKPNRGYVDIPRKKLTPGQAGTWVKNIVNLNGEKAVSGSTNIGFFTGNINQTVANLTAVNLVASSGAPNDAKHRKLTLEVQQPTPAVSLKDVTVYMKIQSEADAAYKKVVDKFSMQDDDFQTAGQLYTVANGNGIVLNESLKMAPDTTYVLELTLRSVKNAIYLNPGTGLRPTFTIGPGTNPDVPSDTAAPTLSTNPDTGTTGPTVKERHSKIHVTCPLPSANISTLDNYQVVLSTQNTAPAGTPSVGSEGVLVILYGQDPTFKVSYDASLTQQFYVYFRAHNQFNSGTYSVWSAGTNQSGYSRPIQDFIGTAAPTLPIRLEATGTAPGSPAVANDTTHFSIDTADSVDYQTFITAGVVLHLNVPSLAAGDTTRKATAYSLANHRFTVDVAYGSTPGNSLAYEIHRGLALGEKAGNASSTTTVVLGTAGAALADHFLEGFAIYMPSQPAADKIRKITLHTAGVVTLDSAVTAALANGACYMFSQGTFGYVSLNPLSGVIAGAPFRVWLNTDNFTNVIEMIMPTGGDAFSTTFGAIQIEGYKDSNGKKRDTFLGNVSVSASYPRVVPSAKYDWRLRLQNLYRDGGSDGWSGYSVYVEGYGSGASPGQAYDPGTLPPVSVDSFRPSDYPTGRFPAY